MDLYRIIRDLVEERNRVQRIIESLEAMHGTAPVPVRESRSARGRKSMDPAARRQVSERMKAYWEKRRQQGKTDPPRGHSASE